MNLSNPDSSLWLSRRGDEYSQQAAERGAHVVAAVEAELRFGQVAVAVLGKLDGLVGACQRRIVVAQEPLASKRGARLHHAADWADEAARPASGDQSRLALLLGPVAVQELRQRQSLLELNSVHRHGASPGWMPPSSASTVSLPETAESCSLNRRLDITRITQDGR